MKLELIYEMWEVDSEIDKANLDSESLKTSQLHHKYYKIYSHERMVLRKYESELKTLKLDKFEFYTQGPSKESQDLGWKLPASGKILKSEVNSYLEADKDIIAFTLKIALQHEKVDFLESIIKSLSNRGFQIKNAIEFIKFKAAVS